MKVRIVRAGLPGYWYRNRIGDTFTVVQTSTGISKYQVTITDGKTGYVDFDDCTVVQPASAQAIKTHSADR